MKVRIILFLFLISASHSFCQKRNNIWCFGDSALIDFSIPGNSITGWSSVRNRGSSVSIADTSGKLLFYAHTRHGVNFNTTQIKNSIHQLMQNGDSIVGEGWYVELVIIPYPQHPDLYYLFSIGCVGPIQFGLYYSLIDMSMNGGLGAVTQKNIQLLSYQSDEPIEAIKHGNGNDWWIIYRQWTSVPLNEFQVFLVDSNGVHSPIVQNVGPKIVGDYGGDGVFTQDGSKFYLCYNNGLIARYDFDRCTGIISNPFSISSQGGFPGYWGIALSKNDKLLYITTNASSTHEYLYQYDLTAPNISASQKTIFDFNTTLYPGSCGLLRLAPDNKIYLSNPHWGTSTYYDSTDYSPLNMNLSVINLPDNLDTACNFRPYSFYLGGKRTYWGLPNNPNYDLGALEGNPCGVGINEVFNSSAELSVTYLSNWQKAFINVKGLKARKANVAVYDLLGNVIYTEVATLSSEYFTKDLGMATFAKGMYIVICVTERERLVKKFIKE